MLLSEKPKGEPFELKEPFLGSKRRKNQNFLGRDSKKNHAVPEKARSGQFELFCFELDVKTNKNEKEDPLASKRKVH